ncbi:uncharacterized protein EI90DRAFT_3011737 [Cantharellus anzutake]|uniref:uncharacterized protein n=1 Tax=Cantharellus anzutake TaxID=1750568 RepID=UPI001903EC24|nr:uncharacterized protein EI90DRAFT_3011737 [Cantharellus anzutake]KAF8342222.1 hypothetical protein EI90DRAFT_3011737 [Cantharellus anzutake]
MALAIAAEFAPVVTVLSGLASFTNSVKNIANRAPAEPKASLKNNKDRWLVCTVENKTDFPILTMASFFSSGRYDDPPKRIDPFSVMTFTCCEGDNTVMQGVTGGHSFYINVDHNNHFYLGLGFCNPYIGGYKASVYKPSAKEVKDIQESGKAQKTVAEKAYDNCNENGNMITSEWYRAKDVDKKDVVFQFQVSASAGAKPVYTINEVREYVDEKEHESIVGNN